jgi:predicted dehydrogenase
MKKNSKPTFTSMKRKQQQALSRRAFIRGTAGAAMAAAVFPNLIPAKALGREGAIAPNSRIAVGVIGCGPQGIGDMSGFLGQKDCQVVAVCDVKTSQLEQAQSAVNSTYQNQDCKTYHDFRELLARKDIDACLIATPDHWHVLTALAAVNAGKDVYVEKPLGITLGEGILLRKAVNDRQRVFQFGTQQRSGRLFRLASLLALNGNIGKLRHINVWSPGSTPGGSRKEVPPPAELDYSLWLGPAPERPHTEDRCSADGARKTWWFTKDYALGFIAGWGIHPIDIALWGGGELLRGLVTIEGRGNFHTAEGICDTATIWDVDFRFASGVTMKFVGVPNGGNANGATSDPFLYADEWKQRYRRLETHGTAFEGSDGWVKIDRGGIELQPQNLIDIGEDTFKQKLTVSNHHVRNFLDCIRSRAKTVCPIEAAVLSDALCHIADISIRLGRKLQFDIDKEQFVNDSEANARLEIRPPRAPWKFQS